MQGRMPGQMSGQMRGERREEAADGMEAWLELRERRIRALEAENLELRRQLDELRRGVGVAIVIEGRAIPLAALAPTSTPAETRPEAAQPGWQPPTPPATTPPQRSGYAFERAWPSPAAAAPAPTAPPWPGHALPSMPTTLMPTPATHATPAPVRRAAQTGANDDSWLTAEHPATTAAPTGAPARPRGASRSLADDAAWLRSGAAWPQPARPAPVAPTAPTGSVGPAFPSAPAQPRVPPANRSTRPVRIPGAGQPERPQNAERNIFADSFIL